VQEVTLELELLGCIRHRLDIVLVESFTLSETVFTDSFVSVRTTVPQLSYL
jgi:hypothetical protein